MTQDGTVAATIVATLRRAGVDRVFCVPGESFLSILDRLRDEPIDVVTCRHEAAAGHMAAADARLTGRVGVCLVSRWPGAAHASIAVHAAAANAVPVLVLVGHVRTVEIGRQSFQEADYRQLFGDVAKRVWVLHDGRNAAELLGQALRVAAAGSPGPTVLAIPEDVQDQPVETAAGPSWVPSPAVPDRATMARVGELLDESDRPLLIAGGALRGPAGRRALRSAAERHSIPVVASNKNQDLLDNTHRCYAGHLYNATPAEQRRALAEADLLLAVGTRLDRITTADRTVLAATPRQPLVHVHPDDAVLGLRHAPTVGLAADPAVFLDLVAGLPARRRAGSTWREALHETEHRWATEIQEQTPRAYAPGGVGVDEVLSELDALGAGDFVVTVDAGTFTRTVCRRIRVRDGRLLGTASSAMGFGLPAAVAAALRMPDRVVLCVVGDGGFVMSGGDLATAVALGLRLVILVVNNDAYATIQRNQEARFPGRGFATELANPDFVRLAQAYGAVGLRIGDAADIRPTLAKALAAEGPALVELRLPGGHES